MSEITTNPLTVPGPNSRITGWNPGSPDAHVNFLAGPVAALRVGLAGEGIPTSGTVDLNLATSRVVHLILNGETTITMDNLGNGDSFHDRGEFHIVVTFDGNTLQTINLPANWFPASDSESINSGGKTYVIEGRILSATRIAYKVVGFSTVLETDLTQRIAVIGDHGEDGDTGHAEVATFVQSIDQGSDPVLEAGDCNYGSGSSTTIAANKAVWATEIAEQRMWVCPGNHDLDTDELDFTADSTPFALGTTWEWANTDPGNTDWRDDETWVSGWATAAGNPMGFGEGNGVTDNDSTTYYFRKIFNLAGAPAAGKKVRLRMPIDDGVVLYINGVEVFRFNIESPISDASEAFVSVGTTGNEGYWSEAFIHEILIDAAHLVAGDNLIAAEVKQNSPSSSDLQWDASLEIGDSTDNVPTKALADAGDTPLRYTNGFAQPLANFFPYVPGNCRTYKVQLTTDIELFVINDGVRSNGDYTDPGFIQEEGFQAEWLEAELAASTSRWKLVMAHRPFVTPTSGSTRFDTRLDWSFLYDYPGLIVINGHTHNTYHLEHAASGIHIINASNVGRTPRSIVPLEGSTAGWAMQFGSDVQADRAVAQIMANDQALKVVFFKTSDGSRLYEFSI